MLALISLAPLTYTPNWRQPRLLLSFWYDPMVPKKDFPRRYAEIAAANFTAVMGGFAAKTVELVEAQLAASEAHGLGVIAAGAAGTDTDYHNSSALWGYQLKDEPAARDFPGLRNWTDRIAAKFKNKLRYINLLPDCPPSQLNATDYESYVAAFVEQVQPDVLSMDSYPNFAIARNASGVSMDGYRANLRVMRKFSLIAKVPFWNYFGVQHVFSGEPEPSLAMLRWQMFSSLAYGSQGLLYFCYWGGILREAKPLDNSSATSHLVLSHQYERARRLNSHVLAYEHHLMRASSTGVWFVPEGGKPTLAVEQAEPPLVTAIANSPGIGPPLPFLIGQFALDDGRTMVMLQNQHATFDAMPVLRFELGGASFLCEVSAVSGIEEPLLSGFVIEAGSAALVVASPRPCGETK